MSTGIIGAGISGLALAHFLDCPCTVIEKESRAGGHIRSFVKNGIAYDIGPHIIFSKDTEIADLMVGLLDGNVRRLTRSNQIYLENRFVKYPFENFLGMLPPAQRDYCLDTFLNNPYERYDAGTMLSFFLKTFGEGITNVYLRPYNEKIWKFDPCFMDTQMVGRIPKPPRQDVIDGARGNPREGYTHQLHFHYPACGGIQALAEALRERSPKAEVILDEEVKSIAPDSTGGARRWRVATTRREYSFDTLVSTMPVREFFGVLRGDVPARVRECVERLRHNSLLVALVNVSADNAGDNFSLNLPDPGIVFHRISKLDFLGGSYSVPGSATFLAEVTFRPGDRIDRLGDNEALDLIMDGLRRSGLIPPGSVLNFHEIRRFEYAYVIYDLNHRASIGEVREFVSSLGIELLGRFARFEYINMDAALSQARELARRLITGGPATCSER